MSTASEVLLTLPTTPVPSATSTASEAEALLTLSQTPIEEEVVEQRPSRLSDSTFVKGLYCDFRTNIDTFGKWYACQIIERVPATGMVTVQPCSRYGDGDPIPLTVPTKNVRQCSYCITDTVHVLDDRPAIPDKDNDYWYDAEIVEIKQNRRALPSYVVLPVNGQDQVMVSGLQIRPNQFWNKGDYWSEGPLGPTKIEHDILQESKADTAKASAEQTEKDNEVLAAGSGLGDLMTTTTRHALLGTPTKSQVLNAPTNLVAVELDGDGEFTLMNKTLVGLITSHMTPMHTIPLSCWGPFPNPNPEAPAGEAPAGAPVVAAEAPAVAGEAPADGDDPTDDDDPTEDDESADYDGEFPYEPYIRIRKDFLKSQVPHLDVGKIISLTCGTKIVDRDYLPLARIRGRIFLNRYQVPSTSHTHLRHTFTPHVYATHLRHNIYATHLRHTLTPHIYATHLRHTFTPHIQNHGKKLDRKNNRFQDSFRKNNRVQDSFQERVFENRWHNNRFQNRWNNNSRRIQSHSMPTVKLF